MFVQVSSRSLGGAGIFQGHQLVYKEGECRQERVGARRSEHHGQELLNLSIVLIFGEIKYLLGRLHLNIILQTIFSLYLYYIKNKL